MITIVLISIISIGLLLIIVGFSAAMYHRARKLNPYNLKKDRLEHMIAAAEQSLYYINQEIKKMQEEKLKVERLLDRRNEIEEFINSYQAEYDEKLKSIEQLKEQLDKTIKDLDEAGAQLREKNDEVTSLQKKIEDNLLKLHEQERDLKILDSDIEAKKKIKDDLESKISRYQDEKKDLETKVHELEKRAASLKSQIEELERTRDRKESETNRAIKDYEKVAGELNAAQMEASSIMNGREIVEKSRWEDLDRSIFESKPKVRALVSEADMLDRFREALKSSGIIFSKRTINAFHTGLKAEDSSPLVVLAGISGTGKSLLPSLYSKAFGFNFLSVAVQPRWDSPQDMFGFYNYMQNRYKATELSRMLWQYDIYNNPAARNRFKEEGNLPMNIVLLDEMNLARVEYYFSDMLSKLEQRRSFSDKTNEKDRQVAEIEIEGGSIGEKEASRRLFVNENTLFVGTMNEDETTQSLSDKVMDRANVLRFGKPSKIDAKMDSTEFDSIYSDTDSYMSFGNWKKLCSEKQLSSRFMNRLDDVVSSLNDELAKVGHPFAYRVWRSIESYVSQYPGVAGGDEASFNAALSDQIEMKILPKLNGVDLSAPKVSQALNAVSGIIDRVKDDELKTAFDNRRNAIDDAFFQWKGVERKGDDQMKSSKDRQEDR